MIKKFIILIVSISLILTGCTFIKPNRKEVFSYSCVFSYDNFKHKWDISFNEDKVLRYENVIEEYQWNEEILKGNYASYEDSIKNSKKIRGYTEEVYLEGNTIIRKFLITNNENEKLDQELKKEDFVLNDVINPFKVYEEIMWFENVDVNKENKVDCSGDISRVKSNYYYSDYYSEIYDKVKSEIESQYDVNMFYDINDIVFTRILNNISLSGEFEYEMNSQNHFGFFSCLIPIDKIKTVIDTKVCTPNSIFEMSNLIEKLDGYIESNQFRDIIKTVHQLLGFKEWERTIYNKNLSNYDSQFIYRYLNSGFIDNETYINANLNVGYQNGERSEVFKDWNNIVQISSEYIGGTVGLRNDGKVLIANHPLSVAYKIEGTDISEILGWEDIIQVSLSKSIVAGLMSDGRVVATGEFKEKVKDWEDINYIEVSDDVIFGLDSKNRLFYTGDTTDKLNDFVIKESFGGTKQLKKSDDHNLITRISVDNYSSTYFQDYLSNYINIETYPNTPKAVWSEPSGFCSFVFNEDESISHFSTSKDYSYVCDMNGILKNTIAFGVRDFNLPVSLGSDGILRMIDFDNNNITLANDGMTIRLGGKSNDSKTNEIQKPQEDSANYKAKQVSAGRNYTVILDSNGLVHGYGENDYNQLDFETWEDIISVSAGGYHTLGLKSNGKVIATGYNNFGQINVESWGEIKQISSGRYHSLGLKNDGTVICTGENEYGACNVENWTDIIQVSAGRYNSYGLKLDGTVISTQSNDFGQANVESWTNMTQISAGTYHVIGLKSDGTVVCVGGQKGDGVCNVSSWSDIKQVVGAGYHSVGLKNDGSVVTVGNNDYGQLNTYDWKSISDISGGRYHTIAINFDGQVIGTGGNEFGQLPNK